MTGLGRLHFSGNDAIEFAHAGCPVSDPHAQLGRELLGEQRPEMGSVLH